MSLELAGKVAIVTGASAGIGAAAARAFAEAGAAVVLAARHEQALSVVAADIGDGALVVPTDVADAGAVGRLVETTLKEHGRLDCAFNNAGIGHQPTPLAEIPADDYERVLAANLRGTFLCMKAEIAAMLESGGGAIVNMSSTAGLSGAPGMSAYAASKHGVIGLTKTAALDYAARGIRVNAVAPGPILNDRLVEAGEEAQKHIAQFIPMRRIGRPEEVARAAVWLCSDDASFVTGATLPIDGGRMAAGS